MKKQKGSFYEIQACTRGRRRLSVGREDPPDTGIKHIPQYITMLISAFFKSCVF